MSTLIRIAADEYDPRSERRLAKTGPIAINEPLVPKTYCRAVLAEPDTVACGMEAGNTLGRLLVGSYPRREINDPRAYALAVASVFAEFPNTVGREAINVLIRRLPHHPTAADVHKVCAEIVGRETQRRGHAGCLPSMSAGDRKPSTMLKSNAIDLPSAPK